MTVISLTALERELLELCSMDAEGGETTTRLAEEMLASPPDRAALEATLRGLVNRGLMSRWRGEDSPIREGDAPYEDDWWPVTDAGRAAIGLPPKPEAVQQLWINPSSGAWRVSPLIAQLCAWPFRRGKLPVPGWYARLTGKATLPPDE
jgi:hypothetical protein